MRGSAKRGLLKEQRGQSVLTLSLILLAVGALTIVPLLALSSTELQVGREVYEEEPKELYTAESGLEHALFQVKKNIIDQDEPDPNWPLDSGDIWEYEISDENNVNNVNDRDIVVNIENIWVLEGLVAGAPGDWGNSTLIQSVEDYIQYDDVTETCLDTCTIYVAYDSRLGDVAVDTLAVWLPSGFGYVAGSSSGLTADDPSEAPMRGGIILEWHNLTLTRPEGGLEYPTIDVQSFDFQPPTPGECPRGVLSWAINEEDGDDCLTWNKRSKIYKVTTWLKDDPSSTLEAEAYVVSEKSTPTWAMESDYRAIGNSLMISETNDTEYNMWLYCWCSGQWQWKKRTVEYWKVREVLLNQSSAEITDIPTGETDSVVAAAYLYWSGFVHNDELDMKSEEVYFRAESLDGMEVYYDGMVSAAADKWDVSNAGYGHGYARYADVTSLLLDSDGNGRYTVGGVYGTVDDEERFHSCSSWGWPEWCYAGWSLIIVYAHPDEDPHFLKLYSDFAGTPELTPLYVDNLDSGTRTITGFTAPPDWSDIEGRLTTFAGEGDEHWQGSGSYPECVKFNGNKLSDEYNPENNVWNSKSSASGGTYIDGVDVDTFDVSDYIVPGDTSATIYYSTKYDSFNWVYLIVSIRSHFDPGAGGGHDSVGIITYSH